MASYHHITKSINGIPPQLRFKTPSQVSFYEGTKDCERRPNRGKCPVEWCPLVTIGTLVIAIWHIWHIWHIIPEGQLADHPSPSSPVSCQSIAASPKVNLEAKCISLVGQSTSGVGSVGCPCVLAASLFDSLLWEHCPVPVFWPERINSHASRESLYQQSGSVPRRVFRLVGSEVIQFAGGPPSLDQGSITCWVCVRIASKFHAC
ncbi:hypothetical protein QBC45DRAFT_61706 [Copromyces sp. CBS 386.78]|nr:hypothetical protein QBC45DRAFT_61706 [Copromyces sp. CBS 386.78]